MIRTTWLSIDALFILNINEVSWFILITGTIGLSFYCFLVVTEKVWKYFNNGGLICNCSGACDVFEWDIDRTVLTMCSCRNFLIYFYWSYIFWVVYSIGRFFWIILLVYCLGTISVILLSYLIYFSESNWWFYVLENMNERLQNCSPNMWNSF